MSQHAQEMEIADLKANKNGVEEDHQFDVNNPGGDAQGDIDTKQEVAQNIYAEDDDDANVRATRAAQANAIGVPPEAAQKPKEDQ